MKVSEDIDLNKQRPATICQGVMKKFAYWVEIQKEKKRSLAHQASLYDFFKSSSGTHVLPPVMLDIGNEDPDDLPTIQK